MTCPDPHCPECRRVYAAGALTWCCMFVFLATILMLMSGCGAHAEDVTETGELEQVYDGPACCWDPAELTDAHLRAGALAWPGMEMPDRCYPTGPACEYATALVARWSR